jgi:hypothetical protein
MSHAIALLAGPKPLTKDRTRAKAARGLERALAAAENPKHQSLSAAIPVARTAVLAHRSELAALAEELRSPGPVYAQGVGLVLELLSDADSPLYQTGGDLGPALSRIQLALDGHGE